MAEGRFTFYLHGKTEKIMFYKTIEAIIRDHPEDNIFFLAFGGYFGIWLTRDDIKFLLESLPMSEAEKQIGLKREKPSSSGEIVNLTPGTLF